MGNNTPIGSLETIDDKKTFTGALFYFIQYIHEKSPKSKLIIMSNIYVVSPNRHNFTDDRGVENALGHTMEDYANAIKSVCEYCNIEYLDTYHLSGINKDNYQDYLLHERNKFGDEVWVHPNAKGAKIIYDFVLSYFNDKGYIQKKN